MTSDHPSHCKAYTGNNKTNIAVPISNYSLIQKLLSSIVLIVLWVSCTLSIIGASCGPKSSYLPEEMEFDDKVSRLPHYTTRCVGSVTIFGISDPADYIMVDHTSVCQQSKREKSLPSLKQFLYDQGCIAPEQSMYQYVIDHDKHGNVTFKRFNIDLYPDPSDNIAATHPVDDAIPNWEAYGLTRLRSYKGPILNDTHTFSLDLGQAKFQNGEQLGFILVKPNVALVDLVKHLLEKCASRSKQSHIYTKDYLILPGIISERRLQDSNTFNSFSKLNLNNYSNLYCYIKKGPHYCFVPLENNLPAVATAYSTFSRSYQDTSKSNQGDLLSLEGSIATSLEASKAADYNHNPIGSKMGHNSALLEPLLQVDIDQEAALEALVTKVKSFKNNQELVASLTKEINIVTLNDATRNRTSLNGPNEIQLALRQALKAIKTLQSTLKPSIGGNCWFTIKQRHKEVVERLQRLKKAIREERPDALSVDRSLSQAIPYLEEMLSSLSNIKLLLLSSDKRNDMRQNVEQLFIGNSIQLKKAQNIIAQLEQIRNEQLNILIKTVSAITEISQDIKEKLPLLIDKTRHKTLIRKECQIYLSDLVVNLQKASETIVGGLENTKYIMKLASQKENLQKAGAKLNRWPIIPSLAEIEEAFNKIADLGEKLKREVPLKTNEIIDQLEKLMDLCNEVFPELWMCS